MKDMVVLACGARQSRGRTDMVVGSWATHTGEKKQPNVLVIDHDVGG